MAFRRRDAGGQRLGDRVPDELSIRRGQVRHVPAGLVAPRPEVLDAGSSRGRNRPLEIGDVVARQSEAGEPELGLDALTRGRFREQLGEAADEFLRRLVEVLPVRIRCEHGETGERADGVPVAHPVRALRERQQADGVLAPAHRHMRGHLAEEIHDGSFTKRLHFRGQTPGQVQAGQRPADVAATCPTLALGAHVFRHGPVGLVPEDVVRSRLERGVRPLLAEGAVRRVVQATGRDAATVVHYLACFRVERHPPALGLAAERSSEPPWAHLHLEPELV